MSYNTAHAKYKSTYLAAFDCTPAGAIKGRRLAQDTTRYFATFTVGTGALEVGNCIAMIRVPAGTTIVGGRLCWTTLGTSTLIALGDPYACARLVGPCLGTLPNDLVLAATNLGGLDCGVIRKISVSNIGDGCGIGYTYTCETDLVVTNLYSTGNANAGGWVGGGPTVAIGGVEGAAITAGTITVVLDVLPV